MPPSRSKPHPAYVTALLAQGAIAATTFEPANNVALYWGQNSYNEATGNLSQQPLATYCANSNVDIIPMAFLIQVTTGTGGEPVINFANQGNNCTIFSGSGLMDCPSIGDDIKTCQQKYNKTILLSIGGATYTEGGFSSDDVAVKAADLIWDTFGPVPASSLSSNGTSTNGAASSGSLLISSTPSVTNASSAFLLRATSSLVDTGSVLMSTNASYFTGQLDTGIASATAGSQGLVRVTPTNVGPYSNATTTAASLRSGATGALDISNRTTDTGAMMATLLAANATRTIASYDNTTITSSKAEQTADRIASLTRTGAVAATSIITKTANAYDPEATSTASSRKSRAAIEAETSTNNDISATTATPIQSTLVTAFGNSTSASEARASTVNYGDTHPRRQSTALRPFRDAVIDGFDLDLESTSTHFPAFASRLRTLMDAETSKTYYLTAAPQCPYPDMADDSMLNGGIQFDAVFVQFYNNYCGVQSFTANSTMQDNFNFATWNDWARTQSTNRGVKIFLGVPGGQSAAGSGYMSSAALAPIIEYCQQFDHFGGIMAWDASQAYANEGFLTGVKIALDAPKAKRRDLRRRLERVWRA